MLISENGVIHDKGIVIENPFESGYMTGNGLFETICVNKGKILFLKEHYTRMKNSLQKIKLPALPEFEMVSKWCEDYIEALSGEGDRFLFSGKLRMNWVKKGCCKGDLHIYGDAFSYPMEWYHSGIKAGYGKAVYFTGNMLDKIKSLSYAENIIRKTNAMEDGFQEAVRVNGEGELCEGSVSNIFWVIGRTLYTPSMDAGILPGIVRNWALKKAKEMGIDTSEIITGKATLDRVDAIFFTNSLMGIMPVSNFENRPIHTLENGIYRQLREEYLNLLGK